MHGEHTVFSTLLKPISQNKFNEFVESRQGDKWVKKFTMWDLFLVLLQGQLNGRMSLRTVKFDNCCTYTLVRGHKVPSVSLSSLSDALSVRDPAVLMDVFFYLSGKLQKKFLINNELSKFIKLIDATPVPLKGNGYEWAKDNHRTRGLKIHTVYDMQLKAPVHFNITHANVNDVTEGKKIPLEAGGIYVYDKGYYDYTWWDNIAEIGSFFVTRIKSDTPYKVVKVNTLVDENILSDVNIELTSQKAKQKLRRYLRLVEVVLESGKTISIVTNKLDLSAKQIAELYRYRWQIELFFKCLKQHLKIKRFWGKNENAVKLQIIVALIAFVLLRLIQINTNTSLSIKYIEQIVRLKLFVNSNIYREIRKIDRKTFQRRPSG